MKTEADEGVRGSLAPRGLGIDHYVGPVAGWLDANRAVAKDNKAFLFVSGPQRVNAQGGTHARASIDDRSLPASRAIVTTPQGPVLGFASPKNDLFLRYYRDMFASLAALPDPHDRMGLVALGWKIALSNRLRLANRQLFGLSGVRRVLTDTRGLTAGPLGGGESCNSFRRC